MKRALLSVTVILAACTTEKAAPIADSTAPSATTTPVADATPAPDTTPVTEQVSPKDRWAVNYQGIGDVHAGMTVDQVNKALDNNLVIPKTRSDCEYMRPRSEPQGVAFLFEKGTLSVVDVKSGSVKTVAGAGIGDTEATVESLYKDQVVTQPAKYTSGHRLIVTPKTGGDHRIVFETDGTKITQLSSGREPAVEYVEGCG